jgi:hypothetical protein
VVGAEPAERSLRHADDCRRFFREDALAVGPGADVDRVFQQAGHRTVVFRRHEQHGLRAPHAIAKARPGLGHVRFQVLVVQRQVADLDELQRERSSGCDFAHRIGDLPVERRFPQASDQYDNVARHILVFSRSFVVVESTL